jgi:RNA polymerase sigma-70 factor (ECF subfamily)
LKWAAIVTEKYHQAIQLHQPEDQADQKRWVQRIYERYWAELCGYLNKAFGEGPPEPEEVAQIVFEKYAKHVRSNNVANPRAFLYAAARNTVIDFHRRENTRQQYVSTEQATNDEVAFDAISPERALIGRERMAIVRAVLLTMPRTQRMAFLYSTLEGRSHSEIARCLGTSKSSVQRMVAKALSECERAVEAAERQGQGSGGPIK